MSSCNLEVPPRLHRGPATTHRPFPSPYAGFPIPHSPSRFHLRTRPSRLFLSNNVIVSLRAVSPACVSEPRVELGQRRPGQARFHGLGRDAASQRRWGSRSKPAMEVSVASPSPGQRLRQTWQCYTRLGSVKETLLVRLGTSVAARNGLLPTPVGSGSKMVATLVSIAGHPVYERATRFSRSLPP